MFIRSGAKGDLVPGQPVEKEIEDLEVGKDTRSGNDLEARVQKKIRVVDDQESEKEIKNVKDQKVAPRTVLHPAGVKVVAQVTKEKTRKISEDTGPAAKARKGEEKRGLVVRKGTEIKIGKNVQGVVIDPALQDQNQKVEVLTRNRGNPKAGLVKFFKDVLVPPK